MWPTVVTSSRRIDYLFPFLNSILRAFCMQDVIADKSGSKNWVPSFCIFFAKTLYNGPFRPNLLAQFSNLPLNTDNLRSQIWFQFSVDTKKISFLIGGTIQAKSFSTVFKAFQAWKFEVPNLVSVDTKKIFCFCYAERFRLNLLAEFSNLPFKPDNLRSQTWFQLTQRRFCFC